MALAYKVLGQVDPTATTLTTLYTCPGGTEAVVSSIVVCNRSSSAQTFRVAVRVNALSITDKQYLVYDMSIPPNDTITLQLGITIDASDVISVYASAQQLSFSAFGVESS